MTEQELERQKLVANAYKRLFETEDGKIVLRDLVAFSGMFDTRHGEFELGRRDVVQRIFAIIEYEIKL